MASCTSTRVLPATRQPRRRACFVLHCLRRRHPDVAAASVTDFMWPLAVVVLVTLVALSLRDEGRHSQENTEARRRRTRPCGQSQLASRWVLSSSWLKEQA